MVVVECVADSGGVYSWEWRSVLQRVGECVVGSGRVSGWE